MAELTVYPNADLAGVWELNNPLPVDGTGYIMPVMIGSSMGGYLAEDSAADALVDTGIMVLPTVQVDDVAVLVTAVSDTVATAELTSGDAPVVRGTNEVQLLFSYMTSGTFTLTYDGQTTAAIAFDAVPATIQAALEALSNIAPGDVVCSGTGRIDWYNVTVTFGGALARTDVPLITTSVPYAAGVDEVQRLVSDRTGGTFTLTYDGQTTASTTYNATASTVQTRLRALANLASAEVTVTGGPVHSAPIIITFNGPSLGETPVNQITVTDSGTGGTGIVMSTDTQGVTETGLCSEVVTEGAADRAFDLEGSFNIPRAGGSYEPQLHVWTLPLVVADSGRAIDFTVADADGLHSWAAHLSVWRNVDTTTPVDLLGGVTTGSGTVATFAAVTPATEGAVSVALVTRAQGPGYLSVPETASPPGGYTSIGQAVSDAIVLGSFVSGYLPAVAHTPDRSFWSVGQLWVSATVLLRPTVVSSSGSSLWSVLDAADESDWVEIASAAGAMYEVVELDLSTVPAGAVILGAKFEIAHESPVRNRIRALIVGINADDSIVQGSEQQLGYIPLPVNQVKVEESAFWYELEDGSAVSGYDRLGIALISSDRHPALSTHRILWARGVIEYEPGGPTVSAVSGPTSPGDPVSWTYGSTSGLSQTHYQVRVVAGAGEDPDLATVPANVLDAAAGEIVYDSGRVAGALVRSLILADAPLGRGAHTVAVRAWARLASGQYVASDWGVDDFDITGTPGTPAAQGTDPAFDASSGGVDVEVVVPAAVSRAWLLRSADAGATWIIAGESPYAVTASTTATLTDYTAPLQAATVRYQVAFDAGAMTETTAPLDVGTGGDIDTPAGQWYLTVPDDPDLNTPIDVKEVSVRVPVRTVTAEQPGNSITASSLPLAARIQLQLWVRDGAQRAAIEAVLQCGLLLRLVNIWGQEWFVRNVSGIDDDPQRWRALPSETTGLRDAHVFGVELLEELGA